MSEIIIHYEKLVEDDFADSGDEAELVKIKKVYKFELPYLYLKKEIKKCPE